MDLPQKHSSTRATRSSASMQHCPTQSSNISPHRGTTNTTRTGPRSTTSNHRSSTHHINHGIASRKPTNTDAATKKRHQGLAYLLEGGLLVGMDSAVKKKQQGLVQLLKDVPLLGMDSETIMAAGLGDELLEDESFSRFVTVPYLSLARWCNPSNLCERARAREENGEKDELHQTVCRICSRATTKDMLEKETELTTKKETQEENMTKEDKEEYMWRERIEKWRREVVPAGHGAQMWDLPSPSPP